MPDFSKPGSDGALPEGVAAWRDKLGELTTRGVIYTTRGPVEQVACGEEYWITAALKRRVGKDEEFTRYSELYSHALRVASGRARELRCAGHAEPARTRILRHTWSRIAGNEHDFPVAVVTLGAACSKADGDEGEKEPTPENLLQPGGTPVGRYAASGKQQPGEMYNGYDVAEPSAAVAEPVSFSYGEHVERFETIDFEPFIERAEERARPYHGLLASIGPFRILKRNWWSIDGNFVVVVVYFSA